MRASLSTVFCVIGLLSVLTACETAADHKNKEDSQINQRGGAEVARICALHGQEREAEVKKLRETSGLELFCPNE